MRKIYDAILAAAGWRHAIWVLGVVSFIESVVFPIPPDVLLVPMVLARREWAFRFATVCTVCSVAGGVAGYMLGMSLYNIVEPFIQSMLDIRVHIGRFRELYVDHGQWAVLVAGVTPIPYKAVTVLSGFVGYPLVPFVAMSLVARGARFFLVAAILWRFGPSIRDFVERRLGIVTLVIAIGVVVAVLLASGSVS